MTYCLYNTLITLMKTRTLQIQIIIKARFLLTVSTLPISSKGVKVNTGAHTHAYTCICRTVHFQLYSDLNEAELSPAESASHRRQGC